MNSGGFDRAERSRSGAKRSVRLIRAGVSLALAAGMLAGCATGRDTPHARLASDATVALDRGKVSRSIQLAEEALAADPHNGGYRALLGDAYLRAGRFASAQQAYEEAIELGQRSGKVALSLALAEMALGKDGDAVETLVAYRDAIPVNDLGLALAMAGQTARGVALLSDQMRRGSDDAKLRQNLAFAYALDGRWLEARVMAAQDVPAGELDARMAEWALIAHPDAGRSRVASLLKVPASARDNGLPAALALANVPSADQLAAEAEASVQAPQAGATPLAAASPVAGEELPALDKAQPAVATAFATPLMEASHAPAVVAPAPRMMAASSSTRAASAGAQTSAPGSGSASSTHLVQLGSFASAAGASRAWDHYVARMPQLRGYQHVTTQVTVNGRQFWRLQAVGFGRGSAATMCGTVKAKGGACLVMAAPQPAGPGRASNVQMARRR